MPERWTLRELGPDDAEVILRADVFDGPARRDWVQRSLGMPGHPDPRSLILVAETAGGIVGFASAVVVDHPDKPPTLFINELGVNDAEQRQGIGRALLAAVRAAGRVRGCLQAYVLTESDNLAARGLYRAAGGAETEGIVMYDWRDAEFAG
jgi:ribosomal protein S18 acetylase RimI-like enzyme